jgi:hypothetical protein
MGESNFPLPKKPMIKRLNKFNELDLYCFLADCVDRFEEFYVTKDKQRIFIKNKLELIKELLKTQEIYGLWENGLEGIFLIFREKGFRPYVKFLTKNNKVTNDLVKYFLWNFAEQEIYCKLKKRNPLLFTLKNKVFLQIGDRGFECLLVKHALKIVNKFVPKDTYINYDELYAKVKK